MRARAPLGVRLALVFGLLAFGLSSILVRWSNEVSPAPGLVLMAWRTGFSALLLLPALAVPEVRAQWRALTRRDVVLIVVGGAVLSLHFVTWIVSLYYTSVASASVLVTSSPLFIAILGAVFLKERLSRKSVLAIAVAVAGAALIGWGDAAGGRFPQATLGNALALGASVLVSIYMLIGRSVRQRVSFVAYLTPLYGVVALFTVVVAFGLRAPLAQPSAVVAICFLMALGPSLLGHGSMNLALRYFPASFLALLGLAEPVLASGIAAVLFGEVPSTRALVGMLVVLGAIAYEILNQRGAQADDYAEAAATGSQ